MYIYRRDPVPLVCRRGAPRRQVQRDVVVRTQAVGRRDDVRRNDNLIIQLPQIGLRRQLQRRGAREDGAEIRAIQTAYT